MRLAVDGFEGGFRTGERLDDIVDDIVLIASTRELQKLVNRVHNAAGSAGMRLNVRKTETMGVTDDKSPITVKVGSETLTEVHSFKYLGTRFNTEATCVEEVKTRLGLARDRLGSLTTLWRSRTLSNESKARLMQALVWPIVTYGAEAWTLNKELTGNIEAFEMQCY